MSKKSLTKNKDQNFKKGLLGILILIFIIGVFSINRIINPKNVSSKNIKYQNSNYYEKLKTYHSPTYSISLPENYQINENKIIATKGITQNQENTIQLISKSGDLSIIIAFKAYDKNENLNESTTCPELFNKKLIPIKLGANLFTKSGMLNCGPTQAAFFYTIKNNNIYEFKVETLKKYNEIEPDIIKIISTVNFK